MPTVADVLKRLERIQKDLEYVRGFRESWRDQKDRFPKIYEGIVDQEKAFLRQIAELRNLGVQADDGVLAAGDADPKDDGRPALSPAIEGDKRRKDSDESRSLKAEVAAK